MKRLNENIKRISKLMLLTEEYPVANTNTYSNIKFEDGVVGRSSPSTDKINPTLLRDINAAAKKTGHIVSVTTAISGHYSTPSRHPSGNAVDIAKINNQSIGPKKANKPDVDSFVAALMDMGYTKNQEEGNKKAVLTFGFKDHDDHVHVSNISDSESVYDLINIGEPAAIAAGIGAGAIANDYKRRSRHYDPNAELILKGGFFKKPEIAEEKIYGSFGSDVKRLVDKFVISKGNGNIKSAVNGIVKIENDTANCKNKISLKHEIEGERHFLQYCNLEKLNFGDGDRVKKGDILGTANDDVDVYLYNTQGERKNLERYVDKEEKKKEKTKEKTKEKEEKPKKEKKREKEEKKNKIVSKYKPRRSKNFSQSSATLAGLPYEIPKSIAKGIYGALKKESLEEQLKRIKKLL